MAHAFPVTIKLAVMALIFEAVFGICFGVIAGMRRGGIFDSTVLVMSLIVIAVPSFVIGFVFQFFVGVKWGDSAGNRRIEHIDHVAPHASDRPRGALLCLCGSPY